MQQSSTTFLMYYRNEEYLLRLKYDRFLFKCIVVYRLKTQLWYITDSASSLTLAPGYTK